MLGRLVTGHPHDTLHTSTCFYRLSNQRLTMRRQSDGNLWQSAIFRQVPLNPAKLCQNHFLNPILLRTRVDQATKSIIYTLFSHFPTFFFYVMFWFHHTVHIYSLIISTLLYIIATYTYSVILYCVNYLYYCIKCRINLKPL